MYIEFLASQKYRGVRYQPGDVVDVENDASTSFSAYIQSLLVAGRVRVHGNLSDELEQKLVKPPVDEPISKKPKVVKKPAKKASAKKAPVKKAPSKKTAPKENLEKVSPSKNEEPKPKKSAKKTAKPKAADKE